jgi:hypothetical protein
MDILFQSIDDGILTNINDFCTMLKSSVRNGDELHDLINTKNERGENSIDTATRLRDKYFYEAFTLKNIDAIDLYELYENIIHFLYEIVYKRNNGCKILIV